MIPILYDAALSAAIGTDNGIGRLSDAISCKVSEERNGEYVLEMEYPINGVHAEDLTTQRIIKALASEKTGLQLFRIVRATPNMNRISVYAQHISYDLCFYPVTPFSVGGRATVADCLSAMWTHSLLTVPFTYSAESYAPGGSGWGTSVPMSIRAIIGGDSNSLLDLVNGEMEWDNTTVKWWKDRGEDNGVSIRYGKNLLSIEQETNIAETVCGVLAYWKNSSSVAYGDIQYSSNAASFPFQKTMVYDATSLYTGSGTPTTTWLNTAAQLYISKNNVGIPEVSTTIDFVPLQKSPEYAEYSVLETVGLCDTVSVFFPVLNIRAKAKVVKTVFDTLLEMYESITLGSVKKNLADTVAKLMRTR